MGLNGGFGAVPSSAGRTRPTVGQCGGRFAAVGPSQHPISASSAQQAMTGRAYACPVCSEWRYRGNTSLIAVSELSIPRKRYFAAIAGNATLGTLEELGSMGVGVSCGTIAVEVRAVGSAVPTAAGRTSAGETRRTGVRLSGVTAAVGASQHPTSARSAPQALTGRAWRVRFVPNGDIAETLRSMPCPNC